MIVKGEIDWEICDGATTHTVHAKAGDIVHVANCNINANWFLEFYIETAEIMWNCP